MPDYQYEVQYQRTLTVQCEYPLSEKELRDIAAESLYDATALWTVVVFGKASSLT